MTIIEKNIDIKRYIIEKNANLIDCIEKIDEGSKKIVFVVDKKRKLVGAVSDGDVRRWIIKTGDLQAKVSSFMNHSTITIKEEELQNARRYMIKESIVALPVIDSKGYILKICFLEKTISGLAREDLKEIPVVIMAGGKGTRLYPYTKILPKPLIPIGDVPIMERIINRFCDYGVKHFWVTVNYKREMIKAYFADSASVYEISYVEENEPLGTAGSLNLICEKFSSPFFVTNCDILIDVDYSEVYKYHLESANELTVVTALKKIEIPYGVVRTSKNGNIKYIEEKPKMSYFINTGMYVLNPILKSEIPACETFHMTDLIENLLKEGRKVGMYPVSEEAFLDMGEFEEMHRMEEKLKSQSE